MFYIVSIAFIMPVTKINENIAILGGLVLRENIIRSPQHGRNTTEPIQDPSREVR